MDADTLRALIARVEGDIFAEWKGLLSPVETDRIGPTTLMLLAHKAAKATLRARLAMIEHGGDEG